VPEHLQGTFERSKDPEWMKLVEITEKFFGIDDRIFVHSLGIKDIRTYLYGRMMESGYTLAEIAHITKGAEYEI